MGSRCGFVYPQGVSKAGQQCRAWAMRGSDPPRCAAHRGDGGSSVGAPRGNKNRKTHGLYATPETKLASIDDVVADALRRQSELSAFIDAQLGLDVGVEELVKLFALHGQYASRIGRLLRDQKILSGDSADQILEAMAQAIDEIEEELGVDLA